MGSDRSICRIYQSQNVLWGHFRFAVQPFLNCCLTHSTGFGKLLLGANNIDSDFNRFIHKTTSVVFVVVVYNHGFHFASGRVV